MSDNKEYMSLCSELGSTAKEDGVLKKLKSTFDDETENTVF